MTDKPVVSDPAKIRVMGPGRAWENYRAAMDVVTWARRSRRRQCAAHWRKVANLSLDQHFDCVETIRRAQASAIGAQWEPWI